MNDQADRPGVVPVGPAGDRNAAEAAELRSAWIEETEGKIAAFSSSPSRRMRELAESLRRILPLAGRATSSAYWLRFRDRPVATWWWAAAAEFDADLPSQAVHAHLYRMDRV